LDFGAEMVEEGKKGRGRQSAAAAVPKKGEGKK